MIDKLKTNGKWSWKKIGAAAMVPIMMFVLSKSYDRYSFLRDHAYMVDQLKKDIAKLEKANGILHSRISTETEKREAKDERIMALIFDMLKHQQNQIQLQQKQLEKKAE